MRSAHRRTGWQVLILLSVALPAFAKGPGQEDLDKATEAKITATSPNDLTKVIDLLQESLDKGLDEDSEKFAEQMLTSTLLERAQMLSTLIFDQLPPDERWRQIRQIILADVERALAIDEGQALGFFLKGRLLALPGGDREAAVEAFGKVIDAPEDSVEPKTRAESLMFRANLVDDAEKQIADYDRAVELVPSNVEIVRSRGLFRLRQQLFEGAIDDFSQALELEPDHSGTHEALGLAYLGNQQLDEALAEFRRAAELAPENLSPLINQARVLGGQRNYDEALAVLDTALQVDPTSIAVLMFRVQIHLQNENAEKALDDLNEVLSLQPDQLDALRIKAEILARTDQVDEAVRILQEVIARVPDNPDLLNELAVFHLIGDRFTDAIEVFTKVLQLDEENVPALRGRSDAFLSIGEHAKAIADYEVALKLAPEDSQVLNNFSWVLSTSPMDELRDGKRALQLAERACEVTDYQEAHILSTLAAAHAELGDFESAREWSAKAVELGKKEVEQEEEPGPAAEQLQQLEAELESYQEEKPWRELQQKQKDATVDLGQKDPPEIKPAPAATSEF